MQKGGIMTLRCLLLLTMVVLIVAKSASPSNQDTAYISDDEDDEVMHPRVVDDDFRSTSTRNENNKEKDAAFWRSQAQATLAERLSQEPVTGRAKNAILFLGDGMSIATLSAARILGGGEQHHLAFDKFPYVGLSKTYCVDAMVADSACSSTAYLGGVKGNAGTIGVTAAVTRRNCTAMRDRNNQVTSILRKAQMAGKSTGLVTTTRVTHASPGGAYAHVADRTWESDVDVAADGADATVCDDIAEQLVRGETGRNLQVVFGGGRSMFHGRDTLDEECRPGRRRDGADLIAEWRQDKLRRRAVHAFVWDLESLRAQNLHKTDYLLGLFEAGHMQFHAESDGKKPSLEEMTEAALTVLRRNPKGFLLFVEGGRIDHAHHGARSRVALDETLELEKAVQTTVDTSDPTDTLIVVTADHAHSMSLGGYRRRGEDVFGIAGKSKVDSLPYTALTYANGPGYKKSNNDGSRYDVSNDKFDDPRYQYPAVAPLGSATHSGEDVAVFARGPWAHLLTGTFEQNFIEHALSFATCLGDGLSACSH